MSVYGTIIFISVLLTFHRMVFYYCYEDDYLILFESCIKKNQFTKYYFNFQGKVLKFIIREKNNAKIYILESIIA